jgi:hypothetical protein
VSRVLSTPPHRISRRLKRHPLLVRLGINGVTAQLLNGKVDALLRTRRRRLAAAIIYLAGGLDPYAGDIGRGEPNWDEFMDRVPLIPGVTKRDLYRMGFEANLFERTGYFARWCDQGQHWYMTDDRRREDCPDHDWAGQKARWLEKERRGRVISIVEPTTPYGLTRDELVKRLNARKPRMRPQTLDRLLVDLQVRGVIRVKGDRILPA